MGVTYKTEDNQTGLLEILTFAAFSFSLIRCLTESSAKLVLDVEGTGGKSETEKNGDVFNKLNIF